MLDEKAVLELFTFFLTKLSEKELINISDKLAHLQGLSVDEIESRK